MEDHHKKRLQERFAKAIADKEIIVLDIPDEYPYMNKELIAELKDTIQYYINET
jgi:protein-tyrosine phosphatase